MKPDWSDGDVGSGVFFRTIICLDTMPVAVFSEDRFGDL